MRFLFGGRKRGKRARRAAARMGVPVAALRMAAKPWKRGKVFKVFVLLRFVWGAALVAMPEKIIEFESGGTSRLGAGTASPDGQQSVDGESVAQAHEAASIPEKNLVGIARMLGARHMVQATFTWIAGPRSLRLGSLVDSAHAASGAGFGVLEPDHSRLGFTDASLASGWAVAGLGVAKMSRSKSSLAVLAGVTPEIGRKAGKVAKKVSKRVSSKDALPKRSLRKARALADQASGPLTTLATSPALTSQLVKAALPSSEATSRALEATTQALHVATQALQAASKSMQSSVNSTLQSSVHSTANLAQSKAKSAQAAAKSFWPS